MLTRHRALADHDRLARAVVVAMVVGDTDLPAIRRWFTSSGDVAAQRNQHSAAGSSRGCRRGHVRSQRLRGGSQVKAHPPWQLHAGSGLVKLHSSVSGCALNPRRRAESRLQPKPMRDQRRADRWVDQSIGVARDAQAFSDRHQQQRANDDGFTRRGIDQRQLSVLPKARAVMVEQRDDALDLNDRRRKSTAIDDDHDTVASPQSERVATSARG